MVYSLIFQSIDLYNISLVNNKNSHRLESSFSNNKISEDKAYEWVKKSLFDYGMNKNLLYNRIYSISIYYPKKELEIKNQTLCLIKEHSTEKNYPKSKVAYMYLKSSDHQKQYDIKTNDKVIINKLEDNIYSIIDKMSIFLLRKKYYIRYEIFELGDIFIKLGSLFPSEDFSNSPLKTFFQIESEIKLDGVGGFLKDIVEGIFHFHNETNNVDSKGRILNKNTGTNYFVDDILLFKDLLKVMGKSNLNETIYKNINDKYDILQLVEIILK